MSGIKMSRTGKWQAIKNLDAFPRAEDHLMQKTSSGAAVSAIGLFIMAILFVHELRFYLETVTVHEMSVDVKRGEKLPIHINMTFPALPCEVLSLDAIDMSGQHEVDLDTNIWKLRLHRDGYVLGSEYVSDLVEGEHIKEEHKIGHKDELKDGDHQAVKDHAVSAGHGHEHDEHGIHGGAGMPIHSHLSQKDPQKVITEVKKAIEDGEGCQVFGVLDVERVAGNFHISVHGLGTYVASKIFETGYEVNVSHIIHDLSFGPSYPGVHNPLDGNERILHDISGTFKYFLKIVPTEYHHLHGEIMPTNQFSVTEYFQRMKSSDRSYPAVYFVYDLSPIVVTITEHRRNFWHFITRLCAVLGGTFAVTERGLQDSVSEVPVARMDVSIVKTPTREEGRARDGSERNPQALPAILVGRSLQVLSFYYSYMHKHWRWIWLSVALLVLALYYFGARTFHMLSPRNDFPLGEENVSRRKASHRQEMLEQVYHSADLFRRDFKEMEAKLKVYMYPDGDPETYFQTPRKLTGKYASEGYFFQNLRESRFVTNDSAAADLYFLPISCHKMRGKGLSYENMADIVMTYVESLIIKYPFWNRTLGADHFFVTCHDVGARATAKVEHLVKNSIRVVCSPSYNGSFIPHKDVALPQVLQPFPLPAGGDDIPQRTILGFWAGHRNSKVRVNLAEAWQHDPVLFITNNRISRVVGEYVYQKQFYRSKFCICPAGSQVNSARISESIHYGCVPVIMADFYDLPFNDILDWRRFSLILRERDYGILKKVLQGVTMKEYRVLHAGVRQVRKHFEWHSPPVKYDAFHMVMYELWLRRFAIRY